MRSKLLITSAAALLAGTMLAAGQGATERKEQPPVPGASQSQPKGAPGESKGIPNRGAQEEKGKQPSTTGQAPRIEENRAQDQQKGTQQKGTQQKGTQQKGTQGQSQERAPGQTQAPSRTPGQTQGQSPRNQEQGQTQRNQEPSPTQGQREPEQNRVPGQAPNQQGQREGGGTSVTLTNEQRTTIRQTVLEGRDVPRVSNVTFSVTVGTVVPRAVRIVEVPETIIRIHPEWRRHRYFVYNDEIIIVEADTLRIVAVLTL
jgi:hypothetical protein